jgi:hypothetical protein
MMNRIGILFDIGVLGEGFYGYEAYKILFAAVDTRQLAGCSLSDGDTNATLRGGANQYCIAIQSHDAAQIDLVKSAMSKSGTKALLPLSERFMDEFALQGEPLVQAAHIDQSGHIVNCPTTWIVEAWEKTGKR